MPIDKNKYLRLQFFDFALRKGRKMRRDRLFDFVNRRLAEKGEFPVSKRTLDYDIKYMREQLGAPLVYDRSEKFYYYEDKEFTLFNFCLDEDEIISMKSLEELLKPFRFFPFVDDIMQITERLSKDPSLFEHLYFPVVQLDHNQNYKGLKWLKHLIDALHTNRKILLTYQPFGKREFKEKVRPILIKEYNNRWFLLGKMENSPADYTAFAFDRIKKLKILDEYFYPSEKDAVLRKLKEIVGISYPVESKERVKLFVYYPAAHYVKTKPIHTSQRIEKETEEGMEISLNVRINYELKQVILQYMPNIRILSPESLRTAIEMMLKKGLERVKNHP